MENGWRRKVQRRKRSKQLSSYLLHWHLHLIWLEIFTFSWIWYQVARKRKKTKTHTCAHTRTHPQPKTNTSKTSSCVAMILNNYNVCQHISGAASGQGRATRAHLVQLVSGLGSEGGIFQVQSETLLVVSGDTCVTWQTMVPWQEHSVCYACKSFHNSSASFLFDIVSEGRGLLAEHTQKPVPQHI